VLEIERADRSYALDSIDHPPFLRPYWQAMVEEAKKRADIKPE